MSGTSDPQNTVDRPQVKSALIQAVENDDENEVKRLIYEGADVNETDDQGKTPLIYAVQNDVNINVIKALVEEGEATVNAQDRYERTSLFYAITKSTDTASYLFDKADYFDDSDLSNILSFFLESICTKRYDSHPAIDEVLHLLERKGLKPKKLAKTIVNILLCRIHLLVSTSLIESHCSSNLHPMFHLYGKRTSLLDMLEKVSKRNWVETYSMKESIKEILKIIEGEKSISAILDLLKKHRPDPTFADSDGNTAFHFATCLPWMGVPHETVKEICEKLQSFGVPLDKENHLGQTPLLLCLSGSIGLLEEEDAVTAMKTLVEVCKFLVTRGSMLEKTTRDGESVFHLVIKLFQQGFKIPNDTVRQKVIDEIMKLLQLFSPTKVGQVVSKCAGDSLNSPLHLWASLELTAPDYTVFVTTQNHTFEKLLDDILNHLIKCGAGKNDRNKGEETPLHLCNTWSAVKLLLNKGANPYDLDSLRRPPLLVAACKKTFLKNPSHFYPDVQEEAKSFFTTALEKKLDPWTVDKQEMSVLAVLIKSETYDLSTALVEVACTKEKDKKIFDSLLNAVCKDESMNIHWKAELAEKLLSFAKDMKMHIVENAYTICCKNAKNSLSTIKQETREEPENNLHCKLVRILRLYGGKSSEYSDDLEIDNILKTTRPVQLLVPWTSESKTHKEVLEKVARRQEGQEIGESICCHKPSAGSFGADIFVGINKLNSKEVAIKRIREEQCTQYLKNLYAKLDCEQVIRYFLHLEDTEDNLVYIVFELMEGNLDAYLNCDAFQPGKSTSLCGDIVKGMKYLHKHEIRHFQEHLKPTSIFYKTHPELCLKITDFDHSQPANCWMAPELLMGTHVEGKDHSKASDMFSCGLILHYILSEQKHPFSPYDCASKGEQQIANETEANIKNGNLEGWDKSILKEASHLVKKMLEFDKGKRPSAEQSLDHPLFWSNEKKVDVLVAVGNQSEFGYPRARRSTLTPVEIDLENNFSTIVMHGTWNDRRYKDMRTIYNEMTSTKRSRKYDTHYVVELVRFIRNAYAHVSESTRPPTIRKMLLEDFVFLEYFPHLVMEVYKVVTAHGWDQTKEEIKYAMNK